MKPVLNEQTGLYGPTHTFVSNMKPVYRWWNRTMEAPLVPRRVPERPKIEDHAMEAHEIHRYCRQDDR